MFLVIKYHLSLFLICFALLFACKPNEKKVSSIEQLKIDVGYLANDSLEGREFGTKGEEIAAKYIAKRFEEIGLTPKGEKNSYYQFFSRKTTTNPHADISNGEERRGRNVIGFIDNKAKYTIVIGAHYDHLGWGEENSLHIAKNDSSKAIHNGADDNASGIAAMLYIAKELKKIEAKNNFLFLAFTGEEKGLWGSNYFIKNPTIDAKTINCMINMDMVGRLDTNRRLAIFGIGTSPAFVPAIESIKSPSFNMKYDSSGIGPSDHTSFYTENIPVLHFFTGQHKDYHKPTDDANKINYTGLADVSSFIYQLTEQLDQKGKLPFLKTKEKEKKSRRFNVTLGVIPDYLYDGIGLRIDGVKEDRPAAKANLIKGDIVIQMGDLEIKSMEDYMDALTVYKPKQTINILVKRNDKTITRKLTFD